MKILPVAITTAVLLSFVCLAEAAIPGADDPKVYTNREYRKAQLAYNRKTLTDAYAIAGDHDDAWDDLVGSFLEGRAIAMTNAGAGMFDELPPGPSLYDEEAAGRKIMELGCTDPLVLDMMSLILKDLGRTEEMRPMMQRAANELAASRYPAYRKGNSARRARQISWENFEDDLVPHYMQLMFDANVEAAKSMGPGIERRILMEGVSGDFSVWPLDMQKKYYETIRDAKCDAWFVNTIGGLYHIKNAWEARGSGYANTVTNDGWKKFASELNEAATLLEAAEKAEPTYPEHCVLMIEVEMGRSGSFACRTWFNKAVARHFDYQPAYNKYVFAIYPRWYGSADEMIAFADECAATHRWDTEVPFKYIDFVNDAAREGRGHWNTWRKPGVFARGAEVLRGYADANKENWKSDYCYSQLAGFAWQVGDYKTGREALDAIKNGINDRAFAPSSTLPARTLSGIHTMTGPNADKAKQAESAAAAGKLDDAISTYEAMAKAVTDKTTSNEYYWITGRAQELRWLKQFNTGEWVNLMPNADFEGWDVMGGQWESDGSSLTATTNGPSQLICGQRFGKRWELSIKIESMETPAHKGVLSEAGPLLGWFSVNNFRALYLRPTYDRIGWQNGYGGTVDYRVDLRGKNNRYVIKMWDDHFIGLINGELWPKKDLYGAGEHPDARIGIGTDSTYPDDKFSLTDIKIRKLTERPAEMKKSDDQAE